MNMHERMIYIDVGMHKFLFKQKLNQDYDFVWAKVNDFCNSNN
jgi:hypothetical protein